MQMQIIRASISPSFHMMCDFWRHMFTFMLV